MHCASRKWKTFTPHAHHNSCRPPVSTFSYSSVPKQQQQQSSQQSSIRAASHSATQRHTQQSMRPAHLTSTDAPTTTRSTHSHSHAIQGLCPDGMHGCSFLVGQQPQAALSSNHSHPGRTIVFPAPAAKHARFTLSWQNICTRLGNQKLPCLARLNQMKRRVCAPKTGSATPALHTSQFQQMVNRRALAEGH